MIRRLIGATTVTVLLASTAAVLAEGPMSPVRSLSPGVARIVLPPVAARDAPTPQAGAADVKHPAAAPVAVAEIPPPASNGKVDAPAAVAETRTELKQDTMNPATPLAAERQDDKTESKTAERQKKPRIARAVARQRRVYATRYPRPSYYWAVYGRSASAATSMPYTPGFGPAPYSASGN
jgi:hypothetical protein